MFRLIAAASLAWLASSCVMHSTTTALSGVDGIRGEPIEYQTTTSVALYGLFTFPILGNASSNTTVERFAAEASERGATRMRVMDSKRTTLWLLFPPLSFFIHPVLTTVEGEVEGTVVR